MTIAQGSKATYYSIFMLLGLLLNQVFYYPCQKISIADIIILPKDNDLLPNRTIINLEEYADLIYFLLI